MKEYLASMNFSPECRKKFSFFLSHALALEIRGSEEGLNLKPPKAGSKPERTIILLQIFINTRKKQSTKSCKETWKQILCVIAMHKAIHR